MRFQHSVDLVSIPLKELESLNILCSFYSNTVCVVCQGFSREADVLLQRADEGCKRRVAAVRQAPHAVGDPEPAAAQDQATKKQPSDSCEPLGCFVLCFLKELE